MLNTYDEHGFTGSVAGGQRCYRAIVVEDAFCGVVPVVVDGLWTCTRPKMVTVLSSAWNPRSTCNGSHGLSSSFSAMQQVIFPACPNADRSSSPGKSATDIGTDESQRATDGCVRCATPCPKRLNPSLISNCFRIGPVPANGNG